ncbi:5-oxoprolinase subunit C family protein [Novispirillum itersonii]|uniref:5-oxoprolinase subunit C family protein n=1 Tax=Novispirillum itersonii TaxID=189 RepID=UPI00036D665A|nr:biotin-dependent carboxyltransferase family protein [Novispirillum itersonii]
MTRTLQIVSPGALSLIQDGGATRSRALGVPVAGCLDRTALILTNALLGNAENAAVIEVRLTSPTLRASGGPVRLALSGSLSGHIIAADDPDSRREVRPWTAFILSDGESLKLAAPERGGIGVIAVDGGVAVPDVIGSRSTQIKAGFGGFQGRPLQAGDALPLLTPDAELPRESLCLPDGFDLGDGPIRVVAGPQEEYFTAEAYQTLTTTAFTVSREADRMGFRLEGTPLKHDPAKGSDIISDGIAPGAMQVPGSGLPIILMADAQTTGGYPKIATVISADLPRLANRVPGETITFSLVSVEEAEQAARALRGRLDAAIASIAPERRPGEIDLEALYTTSLIDGMVDMRLADHFPGNLYTE